MVHEVQYGMVNEVQYRMVHEVQYGMKHEVQYRMVYEMEYGMKHEVQYYEMLYPAPTFISLHCGALAAVSRFFFFKLKKKFTIFFY